MSIELALIAVMLVVIGGILWHSFEAGVKSREADDLAERARALREALAARDQIIRDAAERTRVRERFTRENE